MSRSFRVLAAAAGLSVGLIVGAPVPADDVPQAPTKDEQKMQAREARIQSYYRKKEERRARRELGLTPAATAAETAEDAPRSKRAKRADRLEPLPRDLARAQANVRQTAMGQDPTVQQYLDLVDRQAASGHQLAAFGNFIAQNGLTRDALVYYEIALYLVEDDPLLWVNAGTLYRQVGERQQAMHCYGRALALDPNNALAHYNFGATLDAMGRYDEAIEAFKYALTLDPTLGDPETNPQAANNARLMAVKLMLYQEQAGSMSLPLSDIPRDRLGNGSNKR